MTPTLLNGWLFGAGLTFLGLLVAAGLHFKDPKQRGALLLLGCILGAALWPLLVPFWGIERLLWRPLGALATRRLLAQQAERARGLPPAMVAEAAKPPAAQAGTRFYGEAGRVEVSKGPPS